MTQRMNVKNGILSFHSYATIAYAVSAEKYIVQIVAPAEIMNELRNPLNTLNVFPSNTAQLLLR